MDTGRIALDFAEDAKEVGAANDGMAERSKMEPGAAMDRGGLPFISVVIPAHNEEQYLPRTLEALRHQTYPRFEVVVVANGCTDRTVAIACEHGCRCIDLPERGLSKARNLGAIKARGELLVFLDADTLLDPDGLATIGANFKRQYSSGTLRGVPDTLKRRYRALYFLKNLIHRTHLHHGSSGVILCWRDEFKMVGGFDENMHLKENSDLIQRLSQFGGYKYLPEARAVTSMRRFEKRGMAMYWLWFKIWLISLVSDVRNRHYEAVR